MQIMEKFPKPILVISSSVQATGDEETIFTLLDAGAVDVFPKPLIQVEDEFRKSAAALVKKIVLLSGVHAFKRKRKIGVVPEVTTTVNNPNLNIPNYYKIIGIGASTGGPQVLAEIFRRLKPGFPIPIVCVQHISNGFTQGLVEWLDKASPLTVRFAENGDTPKPGHIYFPPEETHLKFDSGGRFVISNDPPKNGHRPSVDETFYSIAQNFGKHSLAILLTGMGADGADGLLSIKKSGGYTIAQNENSCVVYGMPKVAAENGATNLLLSPDDIITLLNNFCN
jgi:two-component system chemotaxis response regulator CheB